MKSTLVLGSNLQDREHNLAEARIRLCEALSSDPVAESRVLETEAVGFDGPAFLNQAVVFETELSPQELLRVCKDIERAMGRTDAPEYDKSGRRLYHDRIIDIDILLYGDLRINTPELVIPHPQLDTRSYVRELLKDL